MPGAAKALPILYTGAGAVVAAAGYASAYAPDLAIRGVVATGAPNLSKAAIESGLASVPACPN